MTTAQDQQSREAYEDGKWYWVEHEGWHGEPPTIAPACYKAECDAWYSYIFSGISTPYLKVLGPCELQAARALPASMKPVAEIFAGDLFRVSQGPDAEPVTGDHDLYTAAQVLAMLAQGLAPGWQAVPQEPTTEMVDAAAEAYMPFGDMALAIQSAIAAATRPPAAPATTEPQAPTTGAGSVIAGAAPAYRLLQRDIDTIQADDEFLRDDAVTWQEDPKGIFVGMAYMSNVLRPARRAIESYPEIK